MAVFHKILMFSVGAAAVVSAISSSATVSFAQSAPVGACFQPPAALGGDEVASFLADPASLLSTYPAGGLPLSTRARALAGSSMNTVDALISLASAATPVQKSAIGAGLARAARACVATNPQYAAQIQQKVAASNLADVVTAFLAASNDVQTAALGTGGAGAGAAGGIGGGGATNGGSGDVGGDAPIPTSAPTFSNVGGGGSGGRTTTRSFSTFITNNNDVSPTE